MSRVAYVTREDLPEEKRPIYDQIASRRGDVARPFQALLNSPDLAGRIAAVGEQVRFHSPALPDEVREIATLTTARELDCQYEWSRHVPWARTAGVREEEVSAIRRVTQGELVLGGSLLNSPEIAENALGYLRNALHGADQADSSNGHLSAGESGGERVEREDTKAATPRRREDEGGGRVAESYELTRPDALRHTGPSVHPEPGSLDGGVAKDASEWLVAGRNGDAFADQSPAGPESFPSGATLYQSDVELVVEPPLTRECCCGSANGFG